MGNDYSRIRRSRVLLPDPKRIEPKYNDSNVSIRLPAVSRLCLASKKERGYGKENREEGRSIKIINIYI